HVVLFPLNLNSLLTIWQEKNKKATLGFSGGLRGKSQSEQLAQMGPMPTGEAIQTATSQRCHGPRWAAVLSALTGWKLKKGQGSTFSAISSSKIVMFPVTTTMFPRAHGNSLRSLTPNGRKPWRTWQGTRPRMIR